VSPETRPIEERDLNLDDEAEVAAAFMAFVSAVGSKPLTNEERLL
jgi:hypothetical protein